MTASPLTLHDALAEGTAQTGRTGLPTLVSVVEPVATHDLLHFFEAGRGAAFRTYWEPPEGVAFAGVGVALTVDAGRPGAAEGHWHALARHSLVHGSHRRGTGPLLIGTFPFDASATRSDYPAGRLVVPRYLLTRDHEAYFLTINTMIYPGQHVQATQFPWHLLAAQPSLPGIHPARVRQDSGREHWESLVKTAVCAIHRGEMAKVVVARNLEVHGRFSPASTLDALRQVPQHAVIFAVEHGPRCFLGASPEWLVRVHGERFSVDCLAGTTPRGAAPNEDQALGHALLGSAKDRHEHDLVVETVVGRLAGLRLAVSAEPQLLKLPSLQHLHTPIRGDAGTESALSLADRLHPTPAVAGLPLPAALHFLRTREKLLRGPYAGPVGWCDGSNQGEFVVGLRSALLQGETAHVFAGCGIVAGSTPSSEYDESELKMRTMLHALGASRG